MSAFCFREDIHVCVIGRLNKQDRETVCTAHKKIYGDELDVEIEGWSNNKVKFLDCWLFVGEKGFFMASFNKNVNYFEDEIKEDFVIKRLPDRSAGWHNNIYKATMGGILLRCVRSSSEGATRVLSYLQLEQEWKFKEYKNS